MTNQPSTSPQHTPVTVIGLGPMGFALAETLLEHGHPTTVWNRTPEKANSLVTKGVHRAGTVAEAVSASPVTIMCLKDYEIAYNTALLDMMYATMNGFLYATALVWSANVSAVTFADLALNWFMPSVVDSSLTEQAPDLDKGDYPGDVGTMEMHD